MNEISSSIITSIGALVVIIAIAFGLGLLFAFPIKWLWNWLIPSLFNLPTINFWKAWGLMILCNLLFNSGHSNINSKSN